jgi:hypothetical protein
MTNPPPALGYFVKRLAARDFDGLAACLDPDVRLRAVIPPGPEEHHGRAAAAGRFDDWFADAVSFELVEHRIEPFVDRWLATYRIALDEGDGPRQVEQHLFCDVGAELIDYIDLLCSGFRPVARPPRPVSVTRLTVADDGSVAPVPGL